MGPPIKPVSLGSSTMLEHIYNTQQKFPNAVVLTQVGSFMELYFDQASKYGPMLNLKVAYKNQSSPIPGQPTVCMSGFPLSQKEKYERLLVCDFGLKVVTLMQDSKEVIGGGSEESKRPVTRILTPGTLLGESFVDESKSNYLASLSIYGRDATLMWVDVANGDVMYEDMRLEDIGNALARVSPSEVIIDSKLSRGEFAVEMVCQYAPNATISRTFFPTLEQWRSNKNHSTTYKVDSLSKNAQRAFMGLNEYITNSLPTNPIELQTPSRVIGGTVMELDASARASLDLTPSSRLSGSRNNAANNSESYSGGQQSNSLYTTIKRTNTASGSRLLHDWLSAPLLSIEKISERQDKVKYFLDQNPAEVQNLRRIFQELPDGSRVLQKLRSVNVDPRDLIAYASSIVSINKIKNFLHTFPDVPKTFTEPLEKYTPHLLESAITIVESIKVDQLDLSKEGPLGEENESSASSSEESSGDESLKTTGKRKSKTGRKSPNASSSTRASPASHREYIPVLNENAFKELQEIYTQRKGFNDREAAIRERLIDQYGSSVELRWSPQHDHHIKITRGPEPAPELVLARSKNTIYFLDTEWKILGTEILESSAVLKRIEEEILDRMRREVISTHISHTREVYKACDELDVILSFAQLAQEHHLVRPKLVENPGVFEIKGGRHLTIEIGLSTSGLSTSGYIPNDCDLSNPQPVCMITGPNMGGKSTYLRQNAIIALLAQTGCYVPCDEATLGIVDRIYCRIGAGDDLYRGRSTFMVEMLEAAEILNTATERSLAIVDEVGRGTSNNDGVAIAYASIKHLALRTKCRVLFATHYGTEIKQLLESEKQSGLTDVIRLLMTELSVNPDGKLVFHYNLKEGIATSSRGLLIAELAGFPAAAMKDAHDIVQRHNYV